MSENQKVLQHFKRGMHLTCFDAIRLGLTHNLRSRISNLIDQGHDIQKQFIQVTKKDGSTAMVKEYWLSAKA